jgi:hypothetical protein
MHCHRNWKLEIGIKCTVTETTFQDSSELNALSPK